jgi:hypothetical protein
VVAIAAGWYHNLAVKSDGTVWAWGANWDGQLGNGTTNLATTPVQVKGLNGVGFLTDVVALAAGQEINTVHDHTLALKSDGTVWAWGANGAGQLGDGTANNRTTPMQVSGLTGIIVIEAGAASSHAVKSDGTVWAWGFNGDGVLGDGTNTIRYLPVQAISVAGVITVVAGHGHSLVFKDNWEVLATGNNTSGQLGDGTTTSRNTYTPTVGLNRIDDDSPSDSHDITEAGKIPTTFLLEQNYPNPFNPSTTIRFGLPTKQKVTLRIFNTLGQIVATLYNNESLSAGYHTANFDASNLASGTYVYKLEATNDDGKKEVLAKKMVLMR